MSVRISVDLLGDERLMRLLTQGGVAAADATARALYEEAQLMFAESQRMVPVKTGALRASGQVLPPRAAPGGGVEVIFGYGGSAVPYAAIVHERLDVSHDNPTSAKYLEQPVLAGAADLASRIADRVDAAMRRF